MTDHHLHELGSNLWLRILILPLKKFIIYIFYRNLCNNLPVESLTHWSAALFESSLTTMFFIVFYRFFFFPVKRFLKICQSIWDLTCLIWPVRFQFIFYHRWLRLLQIWVERAFLSVWTVINIFGIWKHCVWWLLDLGHFFSTICISFILRANPGLGRKFWKCCWQCLISTHVWNDFSHGKSSSYSHVM